MASQSIPASAQGSSRTTSLDLTPVDQVRRLAVLAAEVFCILGTLVGTGVIGQRVEDSAGGALSDEATLIAPAGPAFSIWTPIYVGLLAYTVWQLGPRNTARDRTRATGWLAAASMVLNATWLLVTQQDWIWASVVVIVVLWGVLFVLVSRLGRHPARGWVERLVVDVTFGLYLGWVTVATAANVAAALLASGTELGVRTNPVVAVGALVLVTAAGVWLAGRLGGRWPVAAALAWGLAWISVGRLVGEPRSALTGLGAAVGAAVVLAASALARRRRGAG